MESNELNDVRRALAARVENCFDRLDDVVSELIELHEVSAETIIERVHRAIAGSFGGLEASVSIGSD